jgi:hypothetical protein
MITKANISGWKWRFSKGETFTLPFTYAGFLPLLIESRSGNVLVELIGNKLRIERHYHFDGATYAPDFKGVLRASAVHDALLQIIEKHPNKLSRNLADKAFNHQMKKDKFKLRLPYFWGVKLYSYFKK